jgi:ribonuclease HII
MRVIGIDEVGLGCLAGPVISAAVYIGDELKDIRLVDSKKMSPSGREKVFNTIKRHCFASVGMATPEEIDNLNILSASHLSMRRAVKNLPITPDKVLIDGKYVPDGILNAESIIKGDNLVREISAASIFAKVFRDRLMIAYASHFPQYFLQKNKGYPTQQHKDVIKQIGKTRIHRKSFKI